MSQYDYGAGDGDPAPPEQSPAAMMANRVATQAGLMHRGPVRKRMGEFGSGDAPNETNVSYRYNPNIRAARGMAVAGRLPAGAGASGWLAHCKPAERTAAGVA